MGAVKQLFGGLRNFRGFGTQGGGLATLGGWLSNFGGVKQLLGGVTQLFFWGGGYATFMGGPIRGTRCQPIRAKGAPGDPKSVDFFYFLFLWKSI